MSDVDVYTLTSGGVIKSVRQYFLCSVCARAQSSTHTQVWDNFAPHMCRYTDALAWLILSAVNAGLVGPASLVRRCAYELTCLPLRWLVRFATTLYASCVCVCVSLCICVVSMCVRACVCLRRASVRLCVCVSELCVCEWYSFRALT